MPNFSVLFVCMGNICRSPAAECVFRHYVEEENLQDRIFIDSAGTIGFHSGDSPDPRMRQEGLERGYQIEGSARQVHPGDLIDFDLIIAMDKSNLQYIREMDEKNEHFDRMKLFCDYVKSHYQSEVPDPYYGGREGFNLVLDLLEDGCKNLLEDIKLNLKLNQKNRK